IGNPHQVSFWIDLSLDDVPAFIEEPFAPPATLMKWRVYFYYRQAEKSEDYWKSEGKFWNKDVEGFVGRNKGIGDALAKIVAPADTAEQKVNKLYAYVAGLENQDYRPARTEEEQRVLELKRNRGVEDVLEHQSGTHDELNRLFVALVRSAGIPASLILVPDRERDVLLKDLPSMSQFDGEVAIVQLAGKDVFLDPGTKFCPYGIVDWRYAGVEGLRQNGKGTEFGLTPDPLYSQVITTRMAQVSLDDQGFLSGTVTLVYKGMAAVEIRQQGGKSDSQGRSKLLEDEVRGLLPGNSEISLINSPKWQDADASFIAQFHIRCPFLVAAGKRFMISEHLFQVNEKPRFPSLRRTSPVYFHLPWQEADEVHLQLPPGMEVESQPPDDTVKLPYAFYQVRHKQEAAGKIFVRRDFIMGQTVFTADEYKEIKPFFDKVENDDGQAALLRLSTSVAVTK
ncbi:MAG: transglutaminase domain-containing protein, partial [Acidobacteria bacterium]|nr:transglutaminase domain-containing protein [Acidobacteriota bacterium]